MTDLDRARIGSGDEDRLPWLEPVEDEEPQAAVAPGKLIAAILVCLVALGLIVGGIFWLRNRPSAVADGTGDLIAAPKGDYKVPPGDAGGMNVAGEGDATFAASQGMPTDAAIDISRQPEAPIATGARAPAAPVRTVPLPASTAAPAPAAPAPATPAPAPKAAAPIVKPATPVSAPAPAPVAKKAEAPKPVPAPAKPITPAPEVAKTTVGPSIQLGAFSSEAKAQAAWSGLSGRFPSLKTLPHSVTLADVGGKKLYRLRAPAGTAARASAVCRALTSAKEACGVVGG